MEKKISEIEYKRYTLEEFVAAVTAAKAALGKAKNAEGVVAAYKQYLAAAAKFATSGSLAYIRFTLDTRDKFYDGEQEYYNEKGPLAQEAAVAFEKEFLASPHMPEVEKIVPKIAITKMRNSHKIFSPEIISESQEESKLESEFHKLISTSGIEFEGKKYNVSQIRKFLESEDRPTRLKAFNAQGKWMMSEREKFDGIFDKLVKLRNKKAKKLGFPSYIDFSYLRMGRIGYDKKDVADFCDAVRTELLPVVLRQKKEQAKTLGLPKIGLADSAIIFANGNPKPTGTPEQIFEAAKKMYHDMSAETSSFIDFMLSHDLFDCLAREGKSGGGYCSSLEEYKMPFIFANFTGTSGDVDVLTHEAGHAFAAQQNFLDKDEWREIAEPSMEIAEIHSMTMEHIAYKWMDLFFGARAKDYVYMHLVQSLTFIPYGCAVDRMQHEVYAKDMTPAERNKTWKKIVEEYCPYLNADGITYLEEGTRWQYQNHYYLNPFYYIDYALAQTVAFQIYLMTVKDFKKGWATYMKLLQEYGKRPFLELLDYCGIASPMKRETVREIASGIEKLLK